MRIRTVKPEFWQSEDIGILTVHARLLFVCCFNIADDKGRLRWNSALLKANAFIYDDHITSDDVEKMMSELVDNELVTLYIAGKKNQQYAYVTNFEEHQKINKPQPSKLPPPPEAIENNGDIGSMNDSRNDSRNDYVTEREREKEKEKEKDLSQTDEIKLLEKNLKENPNSEIPIEHSEQAAIDAKLKFSHAKDLKTWKTIKPTWEEFHHAATDTKNSTNTPNVTYALKIIASSRKQSRASPRASPEGPRKFKGYEPAQKENPDGHWLGDIEDVA